VDRIPSFRPFNKNWDFVILMVVLQHLSLHSLSLFLSVSLCSRTMMTIVLCYHCINLLCSHATRLIPAPLYLFPSAPSNNINSSLSLRQHLCTSLTKRTSTRTMQLTRQHRFDNEHFLLIFSLVISFPMCRIVRRSHAVEVPWTHSSGTNTLCYVQYGEQGPGTEEI
jgi:hypothetical protein